MKLSYQIGDSLKLDKAGMLEMNEWAFAAADDLVLLSEEKEKLHERGVGLGMCMGTSGMGKLGDSVFGSHPRTTRAGRAARFQNNRRPPGHCR